MADDRTRALLDRLDRDQRKEAIAAVQACFLDERDEEVGELAAGFVLDAVLEAIAPQVYDLALTDAAKVIRQHGDMAQIDIAALQLGGDG